MRYRDRKHAGEELARRLAHWAGRTDVQVLALPRGGVPVAYEVARRLSAPLDVFLVRKLGVPGHEEYAMGAIASHGVRVLDWRTVRELRIPMAKIDEIAHAEQIELERRERAYRQGRPQPDLSAKVVILVDDGLATGASMRAALQALKQLAPQRVVVAVPVGAPETCEAMRDEADEVVCGETPVPLSSVGQWYDDFNQTSDAEVLSLLESAAGGA